ncbi:hypothetical protein [Micromonospora pisi]|nr:hypothetical protein [Micromonospora pisi]
MREESPVEPPLTLVELFDVRAAPGSLVGGEIDPLDSETRYDVQ